MQLKKLHINTIGCQMNVYDSEQIAGVLAPLGYQLTGDVESADMVIVNTCTIREKAEQKAFSFLGRLAKIKAEKPSLIVAVGGCVAQQEGDAIPRRMPYVDLVFGTQAIFRLPEMVRRIEQSRCRIVDVNPSEILEFDEPLAPISSEERVSAFITIMRGCDNFCTYCVVPHVRGREASRHFDDILSEIRKVVEQGVREVTLLGQNVNSYGGKERLCSFAELLEQVDRIDGLERIRFTTSHPKDLSDDLIASFGKLNKLCHHIHLPVQSGNNQILKRMNRKYTRETYLEKIDRLRVKCPDIAVTSDFIVGFPGETDAQFIDTMKLIETVQYDGLFAFMYSDRPSAPAAAFGDKIPESVKKERLHALLDLQETIAQKKHRLLVGKTLRVLVEGPSRVINADSKQTLQSSSRYSGRSSTNHIVHFNVPDSYVEKKELLTGTLVDIMIEGTYAHSLWGVISSKETVKNKGKGGATIAA